MVTTWALQKFDPVIVYVKLLLIFSALTIVFNFGNVECGIVSYRLKDDDKTLRHAGEGVTISVWLYVVCWLCFN